MSDTISDNISDKVITWAQVVKNNVTGRSSVYVSQNKPIKYIKHIKPSTDNKKTVVQNKEVKINMESFYNAFSYPFRFINSYDDDYCTENFTVIMFDEHFKSEDIDVKSIDFPDDIIDVYWYEKGKKDEEPWEFIGKIKCKDKECYVYYVADCDYTGFDCKGDMKMHISEYLSRILNHAIPSKLHSHATIKKIIEKENMKNNHT